MRKLVHITTGLNFLFFFKGQIASIRSKGYEVHLIYSPGEHLDEVSKSEGAQPHGVVIARDIDFIRDIIALIKVVRILRQIRPDIVHAHTAKAGLLGMVAASLARVPVRIYHLHGVRYDSETGVRRIALKSLETFTCRLAHQVYSVSRSLREFAISERICAAERISVLGSGSVNGVDATDKFNPDRFGKGAIELLRAQFQIPVDAVVIGFVGRIIQNKGIEELALAYTALQTQFDNLHLLIVGPYEVTNRIPTSIRDLLEHNPGIHLAGPRTDLPQLYACMDIFCLASRSHREGFGVVLLEAAAMSLPVIGAKGTGSVDAVEDGVTGFLVSPGNVHSLIEKLRLYISDPVLRHQHGKAGRTRVLNLFKPETVWENVAEAYEQLLIAHRPK